MAVCKPLTDERFAKCFAEFAAKLLNYYKVAVEVLRPFIEEYANQPVDFMSIGAGTGRLENDLIRDAGLKVKQFLALEPNTDHLVELKKTVLSWGNHVDTVIEGRYYDKDYCTDKKFDLILMAHVIYHMNNPAQAIMKARTFLKPTGKLMIIVQAEKANGLSNSERLSMLGPNRNNNFWITSKYISSLLSDNSIKHELIDSTCQLDVSDFIQKGYSDPMSLMLESEFTALDLDLQEEICNTVKEKAIIDNVGQHIYSLTAHLIVVSRD